DTFFHRHGKAKCCAGMFRIVLRPQPAAMRFDDGAADGEAHAQPVAFGGVKGLKNLVEAIPRQTGATIANRNLDHPGDGRFDTNHNFSFLRPAIFHSIERVEHKIEQHLLQLNFITTHDRKNRTHIENHANVPQYSVTMNQSHDFPGKVDEIQGAELELFFFSQRAHPADNFYRTVVILDDIFEDFPHLL